MIDHHTLETAAALTGIATLAGLVLFSMPGPKPRDLDAEGWFSGYDHQDHVQIVRNAHEDEPPPIPEADRLRFFVGTKPDRAGSWRIRDRANFREVPGKLYTKRKSALRAARRLNAKAEIAAALPPYNPEWGARYETRFQVMPYPLFPKLGETQRHLVLDTDLSKVLSAHTTAAAAESAARVLNGWAA